MSNFRQLCPSTRTDQIITSNVIPLQCYNAGNLLFNNPQQALINYAKQVQICPTAGFPVIDGKSVNYNPSTYPFTVPFDEKSYLPNFDYLTILNPAGSVNQDCNLGLNGVFPGCSKTTGSAACDWKPVVLGSLQKTDAITVYEQYKYNSCGGAYTSPGIFFDDQCWIAGSFCQRTAFDQTYKKSCCRQQIQTDFGLSQTVWIEDKFWNVPNVLLGNAFDSVNFPLQRTSQSFNPYEIYCDPQWCKTSPTCDDVFYDLCRWSTTTNTNGVIHACLAGEGECYEWYNRATNYPDGTTALISGVHNWLLIDNMVKDYCLYSSTKIIGTVTTTDTQSCACVGTGYNSLNQPSGIIYYTSCSEIGITCTQDVVPVVPVNNAPGETFTGSPQILTDIVCSNLACLNARTNRTTSFLTSGYLERALACPEQTCILANLNSTFSAGDIGTGTRYIFEQQQFCYGNSFSDNATTYQVFEAPTMWFFSNVQNTITNPNQTSILRIRNVSENGNNIMTWSVSYNVTLPPWIVQQGINYGSGVLPGKEASVQWILGTVTTTPQFFNLPIALTMLDQNNNPTSVQSITLNFAITDIDKPLAPSPSGNDTDPNGIPLQIQGSFSAGAYALLIFTIVMIILFFILIFRGIRTKRLVSNAFARKRFDLL